VFSICLCRDQKYSPSAQEKAIKRPEPLSIWHVISTFPLLHRTTYSSLSFSSSVRKNRGGKTPDLPGLPRKLETKALRPNGVLWNMEEVKKVGIELGKATTEWIKTCSTLESYEKSTHKLGNTFIYICHVQSAEFGDKPE
jgi:hypothetical protein